MYCLCKIAAVLASACALSAVALALPVLRHSLNLAAICASRAARWHIGALSVAGILLTVAFAHYHLIGNYVP